MTEIAELAVQFTGKIENSGTGFRYVHQVSGPDGWQTTVGVLVSAELLDWFKKNSSLAQGGQFGVLTVEFLNQVLKSGYVLSNPLPDFVLNKGVIQTLLDANGLALEDVHRLVVRK